MSRFTVTIAAYSTIAADITIDGANFADAIQRACDHASEADWPRDFEARDGVAFATYARNDETRKDEWPERFAGMKPAVAARQADDLLRKARDLLVYAGAPRAADKVRAAIKSVGGAVRHAENREIRQEARS